MDPGSLRRLLAAACLLPLGVQAQPASCAGFLGAWAGTWSQGFYGTQWIHVTEVSPDCIARVAYNPTGSEVPAWSSEVPVTGGVIEFSCNRGSGGTCRLELADAEMRVRYSEPSGFVNLGVFRKQP